MEKAFKDLVAFHGCYCLDIAMGYRVALALQREMQGQLESSKEVVAHIGNVTCATDAIQFLLGCTIGKRNLFFMESGKPVYILQNTASQKSVRVYVTYWDSFDQSQLKSLKQKASDNNASPGDRHAVKMFLDEKIDFILNASEDELFKISDTNMSPPPMSGKFETHPCACCGEYAKIDTLTEQQEKWLCRECQ